MKRVIYTDLLPVGLFFENEDTLLVGTSKSEGEDTDERLFPKKRG